MSGLPFSVDGAPEVEDGNLHAVPLLCQAPRSGPALDAAVALLAGAGCCPPPDGATVFALVDVAAEAGAPPAAAAAVIPRGEGEVELSALVAPAPQAMALSRRLLADVGDALRHGDTARLVVAAGSPGPTPPAQILLEAGFRRAPGGRFELRL